jgi:hypothetical protein
MAQKYNTTELDLNLDQAQWDDSKEGSCLCSYLSRQDISSQATRHFPLHGSKWLLIKTHNTIISYCNR